MRGAPSLAGALALALTALPGAARAASLQVTVETVRDATGHIRIGVCTRHEFLSERCAFHAVVPARPGSVQATITGIPPGTYSVAVYQDRNDSGHLKRNLLGMPEEDLGFSRNPSLRFGPPSFNATSLRIGASDGATTIVLHHFGP